MSFPRYPAYKDSGVDWLGGVPSHWIGPKKFGEISSLKGRLGWQGLKADEYREDGPFVVSSAHFSEFKIRWEECPHVSWERYELDANIQLLAEDILLMKDGAALGKLAFVDELPDAACLNSHLLLFRPLQVEEARTYIPKFAFYYMQTPLFQEFMQTRGTGATFMGVSQETISRHLVYWPALDEQQAIALFLDRETAKIDTLVAEQEQLITLLKEKRQAVISHAVTKGLDPSVPMKDSGVEWLGDVPAHWDVIPLKSLVVESVAGPYGASLTKDMYSSEGYRVYGQQQVIADDFSVGDYFISEEKYKEMRRYTVYADDVLVSVMGTIGKVAVVTLDTAPGIINPRLVRYRCGSRVQPRFLQRVLMSQKHQEHLLFEAKGTTMDGLNMQTLGRVPVPTPPLIEQAEVLDFVARKIGELDPLLAEAEAAVSLLQERRSALISAAVTGQIDVRGLAPAQAQTA